MASTDPSQGTSVNTKTSDPGAPNTQGITPADKIRYGQSIQEGGMGGKTTSSTGQANTEGTSSLNDYSICGW
jgi:hypothetical protein